MAKENQNTYLVEFKYNEILNDIGKLIQNTIARPESISKSGVARFLKYDDGWRLKAVETRKISNNNQANFLPIAQDSSEVSYVNVEVTNQNCFPQDFWIDDRPIVAIPANESRTIQATSGLHVTMACGAGSSQVWQYHRGCGGPTEVTWIGDNLKHTINRASNCPSIEPSQTKSQPDENLGSNIQTQDSPALSPTVSTASFDCNKAKLASEIAICNNSELRQLDNQLASLYRSHLKDYKRDPNIDKKLRSTQKSWLSERNICSSDTSCLRTRYLERIGWLKEFEAYD